MMMTRNLPFTVNACRLWGSNLLQSPMSAATNMICHDDDDTDDDIKYKILIEKKTTKI